MTPARQRAILDAARKRLQDAFPVQDTYANAAPNLDAPELQRGDWVIIGWIQRHAPVLIKTYLVQWNRETDKVRIVDPSKSKMAASGESIAPSR